MVELTVALHYAFNTPEDQIVWDVGTKLMDTRSSPDVASDSTPTDNTKG